MLRIHLFFLQGGALVNELVQKLLEHIDYARRLEFICICFGSGGNQVQIIHTLCKKQVNGLLGISWDEAHALQGFDLCQRLLPVVGLLLQNCNCPLERVDRLRIVCVHGVVICVLDGAHFRGSGNVTIPSSDVSIMSSNLFGQPSSSSCVLLDVCLEHHDFFFCFCDCGCFLRIKIISELLVSSILHLLRMLLFLTLCKHAFEKLENLLHRRDCGRLARQSKQAQEAKGSLHWKLM
mmetsp:Transcript_35900/g.66947  ORF Transcript_35900/g.66947 Transcript_35900/m.66947 type:complete len:236 (+) Transcript_35900:1331-2038(+)